MTVTEMVTQPLLGESIHWKHDVTDNNLVAALVNCMRNSVMTIKRNL